MKKKILFLNFCFILLITFIPTGVFAKDYSYSELFHHSIFMLDEDNGIKSVDDSGIDMEQYGKEQTCDSLLGDPEDEESVAWLLQHVLNILQIVGPLLVVVLSSFDFAKVIMNNDDDAMKKAGKKLGIRLVLAGALFFIPLIVNILLEVFGIVGTCGIK